MGGGPARSGGSRPTRPVDNRPLAHTAAARPARAHRSRTGPTRQWLQNLRSRNSDGVILVISDGGGPVTIDPPTD